jgi:transposase
MDANEKLTAGDARRRFLKGDLTAEELAGDPRLLAEFMILMRQHIDHLQHQVASLSRQTFGRKSERFDDPNQLLLFQSQFEELVGKATNLNQELRSKGQESKKETPKPKGHGRQKLPAHLPRVKEPQEISESDRKCPICGKTMQEIGREVTEKLCRIKITFVRASEKAKYACDDCHEGVLTAESPDEVIDRGMFDRSFLANIITSKFQEHLPLYRQVDIYKREGIILSTSTLCDQVTWMADLLAPIHGQILTEILARPWLQADETPVLSAKREGKTKKSGKSYLWIYQSGKGRVYFEWTADRKGKHPLRILEKYGGYVQTDDYKGYDRLFKEERIIEVGCMAHARRYFDKALGNHKEYACLVLGMIGLLYEIERDLPQGEDDAEQRKRIRQEKSVPILNLLYEWLETHKELVVPGSAIGRAINHMHSRWDALKRYTEDGRLQIDNNMAENSIRPIAVGRKNWLQFGSEEGGRRAAILMSLVGSCRSIGIDPHLYIWDVIERISKCPSSQIQELTPLGWRNRYMEEAQKEYGAWRSGMMASLSEG